MAWYRTGTIAIANGSTTVTGTNTNFTDTATGPNPGDMLIVGVGANLRIYEIQAINNATQLTLATAATLAVAAGSAYQIQTSMATSNSGLAKKISATMDRMLNSVQNWMNILTGAGDVTIIDYEGKSATGKAWPTMSGLVTGALQKDSNLNDVANKQTARSNISASSVRLLTEGSGNDWYANFTSSIDMGIKSHSNTQNTVSPWDAPAQYTLVNYFPTTTVNIGTALASSWGSDNEYYLNSKNSAVSGYQGWKGWSRLWHSRNTSVDSNGFIKKASPIVKLFRDGTSEKNGEASEVSSTKISTGVYRVTGVRGFNSDAAWGGPDGGIVIPKDKNDMPLLWVDYEVEESGDIIIKTYHRENGSAPKFAQNKIDGCKDGDPIDIPEYRWVDMRVEVYMEEQPEPQEQQQEETEE
ncbi:hypothetical protein Vid5_gp25 [Pantoea phage vB_PagS_Vid5]|uniref:Phage tail protein C-terminal domain-containing protein n=1 Tax=Pantoea phage vB_PagS_Vid5 TaxID=2099652 RepID=A0A2P1CKQ2_9CAUD|nr:tail fiber protein [Pantoea phage vB_PagS_Vid5]AVJ51780.1 hypothetical protein Vid5_gp25 [Pantoea phage vB_PagS_Vid5]